MTPNPDSIFTTSSDELVRFALTTPYDALYFLTVNILRTREDEAALAQLRALVTENEESLDRRFAIARACNDARGAMDLLERESGVISMVPDLIMAARDADRIAPVLNFCAEKDTLQSWYRPIVGFHALLEQLTRAAPQDLRARLDILPQEIFSGAPASRANGAPFRLCGIAKVHNEGPRVTRTVQCMLDICDEVILWDHCSDDGSIDDLESLPQEARRRLQIIRSTASDYNEAIIYDELFSRARAGCATHICHYDADEILAPALTRERVREIATRLAPGDAASFERIQLVGTAGGFIDYANMNALAASQYYLPQWRDFLFADDGKSVHAHAHIHGGWLPEGSLRRRVFLDPVRDVNFHMDMPDEASARVKNDWYKAKELMLHKFPVEKLVYRYMFFALTYAYMEKSLGRRQVMDAAMDAAIEARRTAEKEEELKRWLSGIKSPLEKWLFFHA